jgi:hypothetical protein
MAGTWQGPPGPAVQVRVDTLLQFRALPQELADDFL